MKIKPLWRSMVIAGLIPMLALPEVAVAQDEETTLDVIQVLGSRRVAARSSDTATPVPVDVLSISEEVEKSPQFDLAQTLQYLSPSLNSTRQTGADGADLVDSAALRGLGSDQTLVLINGKRKHSAALVNLFGARNRGNTGVDLNTIPTLAIDRVEILRDGAAAQYGSDAIAGVINIALKKRIGCEALLGYGEYKEGDGENTLASGYCGYQVGESGSLGITAEYLDRNSSDRSPGLRTIGDSATENGTVYLNGEFPLAMGGLLYLTGGVQQRDAASGAFERTAEDIPTRNSAALYPNGFVPNINGDLEDRFLSFGMRRELGEWFSDFSYTYGFNELQYNISNTLNASIANRDLRSGGRGLSPTEFDAGGFNFMQQTLNADFSRYYADYLSGLNVAFGLEYRAEDYEIFAGEPGSYNDVDGAGGGNAGSQGFPGFQPIDETNSDRKSYAAYFDTELGLTEALTAVAALRFEDYSDFGSTLDGKIALALRASDAIVFRGSASTGFRAPSLQQSKFSSTFTDFISGRPVDILLAPNGGTIANAAGIPKLTEETSTGFTLGMTAESELITATLDFYRIEIDDRIVLSGRFNNEDPTIGAILNRLNVGEAQFFVNSVDTKTQGIDLTLSNTMEFGENSALVSSLALNHSKTEVQKINLPLRFQNRPDLVDTLLSERERLFIEQGSPRSKGILGFEYSNGPWNTGIKFIHFGKQTLGTFSGPPVPNQKYQPKTSADLAISYGFTDNVRLTVGGANIFDKFPTRQDDFETDNGFIYESVQFGLNGASYFARLGIKF